MSFWHDVAIEDRVTLYGMSHILFIISVFIIVGLFIFKLDYIKNHLKMTRNIMAVISIIQVIALYSFSVFELGMEHILLAGLPIHLCRLSTLLGIVFLFTENKKLMIPLYYMSVFALVAIFYPVNVHPIYTHIVGYSYQISHTMIVLVWIMIVFIYGYKPTFKSLHTSIIVFFIAELFVWRFNILIGGGEYLYILSDVNRPFFKNLSDISWILFTIIISYIVMFVMTIPFTMKERKNGDFIK